MTKLLHDLPFTLPALQQAYASGTQPAMVIVEMFRRLAQVDDPAIFLHVADEETLIAQANALGHYDARRPLWGMPFAVKDNIDVAGMPTTAACPAYLYTPGADAFVVALLRAEGAIPVGKTNLDQFATGLVGVRSPYGIPRNALDEQIVPGGSSSGSAVAVAHGIVPFSLGTDTAGSGRVPAALNNIVGLKPSLGSLSATGVVPACRTLDTISVFAQTVEDAYAVFDAACKFDEKDAYSRRLTSLGLSKRQTNRRITAPSADSLQFFGDTAQAADFEATLSTLETQGAILSRVDFTPFYEVAEMLYDGAWVAERYAAVEETMAHHPDEIFPVTRAIIEKAETLYAVDAFKGIYRLQELRRHCEPILDAADMLCVPSIPTFYTRGDLNADPITPNSNLGTYTNFVNLLDLCALAVPTGGRSDGRPGSVTFLARSGEDGLIATEAAHLMAARSPMLGATKVKFFADQQDVFGKPKIASDHIELAVCGAHMTGLPLNNELIARDATFKGAARTAPKYRLFALSGGPPQRPGLVRAQNGGGCEIELEIWSMPRAEIGAFIGGIPSPLAIGTIETADGRHVKGFICEEAGLDGARDISDCGGWRKYLLRQKSDAGHQEVY